MYNNLYVDIKYTCVLFNVRVILDFRALSYQLKGPMAC